MTTMLCRIANLMKACMPKLGNVLDRFCERECTKRYADGSVYEGDVEQATQTKA